ncbi:hypothetical protein [Agrobacterium rosae]|uniref:Y-family DNA polymerase n=1 Tax=Agrobacterium rosae TaxID=1972867 RepID=UPI00387B1817
MPVDQPSVVISKSGSKRWVSAADTAARKLGLKLGMPASKAQAIVANLKMIDADPIADAAALERLALSALRQYSPVVVVVVAVDGTGTGTGTGSSWTQKALTTCRAARACLFPGWSTVSGAED